MTRLNIQSACLLLILGLCLPLTVSPALAINQLPASMSVIVQDSVAVPREKPVEIAFWKKKTDKAAGKSETSETIDKNEATHPEETPSAADKHASEKEAHDTEPVSKVAVPDNLSGSTVKSLKKLTDDLHREDKAINNELRDDEEQAVKDIAMLWQAAVERSGTIRFAIEKLSRQDATGAPTGDSFTKTVVKNVVRLGGVAGSIWTGTPAGLMGGNMVEELISGDPNQSALSRVTDADMLLLAKEVESLQTELVESYYQYQHRQRQWALCREARSTLSKYYDRFDASTTQGKALKPVLESLYETSNQEELQAKQEFVSARNALGLLVGKEALIALEQAHATEEKAAVP